MHLDMELGNLQSYHFAWLWNTLKPILPWLQHFRRRQWAVAWPFTWGEMQIGEAPLALLTEKHQWKSTIGDFFFFNKFITKGWRSLVGSAIIGPSRKFKAQFLNWSNWTWQAGYSKLVVVAKAQPKTWLLGLSLVWCCMLSFLLFAL